MEPLEILVQNLISQIPKNGASVDLRPLLFRLTMDHATGFLFGLSTSKFEVPDSFYHALETAETALGHRLRLGMLRKLMPSRKFQAACDDVHEFVDNFIKSSLALHEKHQEPDRYVFLTELQKSVSSVTDLRYHITNLLIAGRDTTAGVMSIAFFVLARRPDIWTKLQSEIDELVGQRLPDYEQLKNMPYLNKFFKESTLHLSDKDPPYISLEHT